MDQKNKEKNHACLNNCNKLHDCTTCSISLNNFCKIFQRFLNRSNNDLQYRCKIKSYPDRQDIISETVAGIRLAFEREDEIDYPAALMRRIYNNKIKDFFRKQPNFSEDNVVVIEPKDNIDLSSIKKVEQKYLEFIKIHYDYESFKSLSATLPKQLKLDLQELSFSIQWYRKIENFFKYNGRAIILKEGDKKESDSDGPKKEESIGENHPTPSNHKKYAITPEEQIERIIHELDKLHLNASRTCANLFREYLKLMKEKEDGQLQDLAPIFGITANAVSQKMKRCRELIYKKIKGDKILCTQVQ